MLPHHHLHQYLKTSFYMKHTKINGKKNYYYQILPRILISLSGADNRPTLKPPNVRRHLNCFSDSMNMDPRRNNLRQIDKNRFILIQLVTYFGMKKCD